MDPLSEILSLLKPHTFVAGGIDIGGPHAVRFGAHVGIKCYAIGSGRLWLSVDGELGPVLLERGDCFMLPTGRPFVLATDPALEPVDYQVYQQEKSVGAIGVVNGGGEVAVIGAHFTFGSAHASMLLSILPPIVHIRKEEDRAALRWMFRRLGDELRNDQPGAFIIAQNVAYLILVQGLRLYLADGPGRGVGWLFALADPQMSAAIAAMHADPAHRWTLGELAVRVGLSRSTFAAKFKATVGSSPMDYLTRWRMMVAEDRLVQSSDAVGAIALALGYESESAFSTAFKRVMGRS
jgi:AraC-like DNA-binding protein